MMSETWRDIARPIIMEIIEKHLPEAEQKKALREAYPFGERKYHPYKIWLDEIKIQTKKRRFGKRNNVIPKEQIQLFQ